MKAKIKLSASAIGDTCDALVLQLEQLHMEPSHDELTAAINAAVAVVKLKFGPAAYALRYAITATEVGAGLADTISVLGVPEAAHRLRTFSPLLNFTTS